MDVESKRLRDIGTKPTENLDEPFYLKVDGKLEEILGCTFPKDDYGHPVEVTGIEVHGVDAFLFLSYSISLSVDDAKTERMTMDITDVMDKVMIWAVSKAYQAGRDEQKREDKAQILERVLP